MTHVNRIKTKTEYRSLSFPQSKHLPRKRKTVEVFLAYVYTFPAIPDSSSANPKVSARTRNKETHNAAMPSHRFYGLLQIPLEDFTSAALKRNDKAYRAGSTTAGFDISNPKRRGVLFARTRYIRIEGNAIFIFLPRNAITRREWLLCAIDDKRANKTRANKSRNCLKHLSIALFSSIPLSYIVSLIVEVRDSI